VSLRKGEASSPLQQAMFKNKKSLVFRLRGLREGVHPIEAEATPQELDISNGVGPVHVTGELTVGEHFIFRLEVTSTQRFICDRCTDEFERELKTPLEIIYAPIEQEAEFEDSGYLHTYDATQLYEVDITEDVHDALLLAVPMKNLCREACPGIAYNPDEQEDEEPVYDTRFASLGGLYEKLKGEEKT
jgi:uncharacterized protein